MQPFYETNNGKLYIIHRTQEIDFPVHIHSEIEIIYIKSGSQKIILDGTSQVINEGEIAVIFPDRIHGFCSEADIRPVSELLIKCEISLFAYIFPAIYDLRPFNPIIPKEKVHQDILCALEHIVPERHDLFAINYAWICVIMVYIMEILDLYKNKAMPDCDTVYRIIKYIGENFKEPITRKSLAKTFNISECYLSNLFSERLKINLRTYIGRIRSDYAALLIRSSNDTMTNIGNLAGFDSTRTFNRVFVKTYGMSPMEYKMKHQNP